MEQLKGFWTKLSLLERIGCVLLLPLGILYLWFKFSGAIDEARDNKERKEVDKKASELQNQEQNIEKKTSHEEGKLEELQAEKAEAVKNAESQDAVDFWNSRPKSDE